MVAVPRLVLASASPRRRQLLAAAGIACEWVDPGGDGPVVGASPAERVLGHARHKAGSGARFRPGCWILAADTLVRCEGRDFPKPADRNEAETMLRVLSGREHEVWTGVCLRSPTGVCREHADLARVHFRPLSDTELERYLDGGEWRGKAGAYAIQGRAGAWVRTLVGDRETVIGLSVATVRVLLAEAGACSAGEKQ